MYRINILFIVYILHNIKLLLKMSKLNSSIRTALSRKFKSKLVQWRYTSNEAQRCVVYVSSRRP